MAKLLEVVKKYLTLLKGKTQAKKTVWEKISKELGEDFSAMECDQKWRNLKESYKNFELNKKRPAEAEQQFLHSMQNCTICSLMTTLCSQLHCVTARLPHLQKATVSRTTSVTEYSANHRSARDTIGSGSKEILQGLRLHNSIIVVVV